MRDGLDAVLAELHIKVQRIPSFDGDSAHVPDHRGLKDHLQKQVRHRAELALDNDVESLSGIVRLRRGERTPFVEACAALFISTNQRLVREGNHFLGFGRWDNNQNRDIPPLMDVDILTTLVWLKKPNIAPEWPRNRLVADCFALLNPANDVWSAYVQEIGAGIAG